MPFPQEAILRLDFFSNCQMWKSKRGSGGFSHVGYCWALATVFHRFLWNFGCGHIFAMCEAVKSFRSIGETLFFIFSKNLWLRNSQKNKGKIQRGDPMKIWNIKFLQSIWNFSQLHTLEKYDHSQNFIKIGGKLLPVLNNN